MPTYHELVLAPTKAGVEGSGGTNFPYVVAPDVVSGGSVTAWVDGSDATYVKSDASVSSKGTYPKWSDVDSTIDPASVYAIGVRFRAMSPSSNPTDYFIVQLFGQSSKLLSNPHTGGVLATYVPIKDTWADYDYIVSDAEYDTAGWAPDGVQSALTQTFIYARTKPSNEDGSLLADGLVEVSEQRIVLYYTAAGDTAPPPDVMPGVTLRPLRQYPRNDGRGLSTARRVYPPSRSAQASNRRAGGYH